MAILKNRFLRSCVFIFGILFLALGVLGLVLPLLPTTPFLLLAVWCFLKSSETAYRWLYDSSIFGPTLKSWEQNRSIPKSAKLTAAMMIFISIISIFYHVNNLVIKYSVTALLLIILTLIFTRNY